MKQAELRALIECRSLTASELKLLIQRACKQVRAKLPMKTQRELSN